MEQMFVGFKRIIEFQHVCLNARMRLMIPDLLSLKFIDRD